MASRELLISSQSPTTPDFPQLNPFMFCSLCRSCPGARSTDGKAWLREGAGAIPKIEMICTLTPFASHGSFPLTSGAYPGGCVRSPFHRHCLLSSPRWLTLACAIPQQYGVGLIMRDERFCGETREVWGRNTELSSSTFSTPDRHNSKHSISTQRWLPMTRPTLRCSSRVYPSLMTSTKTTSTMTGSTRSSLNMRAQPRSRLPPRKTSG